MKKSLPLILLISCLSMLVQAQNPVETERIHIDQFGYKPDFVKVAIISDPQDGYNSDEAYAPGPILQVIDAITGNVAYSGNPNLWNGGETHGQSGDRGWQFDFTALTASGSYYIFDEENNSKSYTFEISETVYNEVLKAAIKMFYYNRCNMAKSSPYAEDNWVDGNNFMNNLQDENARYIYDQNNASLEKDLAGGWFDAGDYNKYVTFAHGAVHNLLTSFDENPDIFGDDWNWPESGNGIPDLLDEINWELEWLEKMSNEDGSVHIKMGSKNYSENVSTPPSENTDPRYYGPICSAASIATASMFAHAAKTYQDIPNLESYGAALEAKAILAFDYFLAKLNANNLDTGCDDGSIISGDADWELAYQREVGLMAAVYLFDLTSDPLYGNYITENVYDAEAITNGWLGPYTNVSIEALFYYTTLPNADANTAATIINTVYPHISQDWDGFYGQNDLDLYRSYIPNWSYHWGSNMTKAEYGNLNAMVAKYGINPGSNETYLQKAEELLHYFHGVNPLTKVYLSNMGSLGAENSVDELYHTWFQDGTDYDNVETSLYGPAPGFIPGGPNSSYSFSGNNPPYGQPAQKSYMDFNTGWPESSWEITEPAIYYQAAYIRLLSAYASSDVTLPLNLISFDAVKQNEDVELIWKTSNEVNTDKFEIEVSTDGNSFAKIGEVIAVGNTTGIEEYQFIDPDVDNSYAGANMIYYRLRILDQNGSIEFSPIRIIAVSSNDKLQERSLKVYPNPADKILLIESSATENISEIQVYNILGTEVLNQKINSYRIELDISQLKPSTYFVLVHSGNTLVKKVFVKS